MHINITTFSEDFFIVFGNFYMDFEHELCCMFIFLVIAFSIYFSETSTKHEAAILKLVGTLFSTNESARISIITRVIILNTLNT